MGRTCLVVGKKVSTCSANESSVVFTLFTQRMHARSTKPFFTLVSRVKREIFGVVGCMFGLIGLSWLEIWFNNDFIVRPGGEVARRPS